MRKRGFTLIELLIVVAIIAILALIAVPNFLEAQVRSKVARVKSDLRSFAVPIEAYAVDHNRVPRCLNNTIYGDTYNGVPVWGILWWGLTTPIAYITNVYLVDPFQANDTANPLDEQFYTYHDLKTYAEFHGGDYWPAAVEYYGAWRLGSVGPDRRYGHGFVRSATLVYDPTNGTISLGNIWRSQNLPEGNQPEASTDSGSLLGPH